MSVAIHHQHQLAAPAPAAAVLPRRRSNARRAWNRFIQTRLAGVGLAIVIAVALVAIFAPWLAPHDPLRQDYRAILQAPSAAHPVGTDDIGRDILSRTIYGSRVSLLVGFGVVTLAVSGGMLIGLLAGFLGGWPDEIVMRTMDALLAFPGLVLAIALSLVLGPSISSVILALGIVAIPGVARLVRAQTLSVREFEFVTASRVLGAGTARMLGRHIVPNIMGPVIVQASLLLANAILLEAGLSFLGLGIRPPTPSWGQELRQAYSFLEQAPWMSLAPGLTLFVVVIAFNLIGDGLRAAFDPRQDIGKEV
jgi:ABC-type dipeptide/oligopeptide/nickel transport system permease subunit